MAKEKVKTIEHKKEKLELLKNLIKIDKLRRDEKNIEQVLDLTETACKQYLELYVKPYFGAFSEHFAPLKFNRKEIAEDAWGGFYSPSGNFVQINIGHIRKGDDPLYFVGAVGHEYEHNFQYKGGEFKDIIIEDKEKFKADVKKIVDKFAYDIVDKRHNYGLDDKELKAILTITNSFDTVKKIAFKGHKKSISNEELSKILNKALYFNRFIEIDARAVESKIFNKFTREMKRLTKYKFGLNVFDVRYDIKFYNNLFNKRIQPNKKKQKLYEFYVDLVKKFDKNSLLEYTKQFVENSKIEYYKTLKQHLDSGGLVQEAYCMAQHDIIANAFKFLSRESSADYTETSSIKDEKYIDLRLFFAQMGNGIIEDFSRGIEYTKEYQQKYFELLKSGDITLDSFVDVNAFDKTQRGELLSTYIERGQIEYANKLISKCYDFEILSSLQKPMLLKQIDDRLNMLANADLQNKKDIAFDGKHGTFDDIDDMINLLSNLCSAVNLPYVVENFSKDQIAKFDENGTRQKIKEVLYKLYKKAEEIGSTAASKIAGKSLSPTEYRYAHPEDRDRFLIKTDKTKRFKRIYGNLAYYNIQQHEQTLRKVDEVLFETEHNLR